MSKRFHHQHVCVGWVNGRASICSYNNGCHRNHKEGEIEYCRTKLFVKLISTIGVVRFQKCFAIMCITKILFFK